MRGFGFLGRAVVFARDSRGAARIFFGVALMPLLMAGGLGLDYLRMAKGQSALREAVEAATRVAAKDIAEGEGFFSSHVRRELVQQASISFISNDDGSVTGVATGEVPMRTLALFAASNAALSATSTAAGPKRPAPSQWIAHLQSRPDRVTPLSLSALSGPRAYTRRLLRAFRT